MRVPIPELKIIVVRIRDGFQKTVDIETKNPDGFHGTVTLKIHGSVLVDADVPREKLKIKG